MSGASIQITGDALPWLKRLEAAQNSERLRKVMAVEAAKTFRQHFRALDQARHRGFSSRNFYGSAASATRGEVQGKDIVVAVGNNNFPGGAIAQRYFGGTIRAKPGKALTIPVSGSEAERTGRRASEFADLFVARTKKGGGFLARLDAAGKLEPLYWLRKSVHQDADPDVLPKEETLNQRLGDAMARELDRI